MFTNRLNFGSCLVRSSLKTRTFTKKNVAIEKKPSKKWKLFLAIASIPPASFYLYYQTALNDQEKRRVRVNIKSLFRAAR